MLDTPVKTSAWQRLLQQEDLNFLLTNRIPRIAATHLIGWYSRLRSPALTRLSIAVWRLFSDLDLSEARESRFDSLQACFTRALKPGARPLDPDPAALLSPCDAIVGALGRIEGGRVYQAKGFPYTVQELFGPGQDLRAYEGGHFVTLRLTSAMYHRFHAPDAGRLVHVTYLSGDTWNVNPIALKRVERLFCRNERAVLHCRLADGQPLAIVAVAAVLVASIRVHALDLRLHLRWRGPNQIPCDRPFARGEELGWFEQGSTLIVFVPPGFSPAPGMAPGTRLRMGQALLKRQAPA